MSPFKSSKQISYLFSQKPEVARKFAEHSPNPNHPKYAKAHKKHMKDMMGKKKGYSY